MKCCSPAMEGSCRLPPSTSCPLSLLSLSLLSLKMRHSQWHSQSWLPFSPRPIQSLRVCAGKFWILRTASSQALVESKTPSMLTSIQTQRLDQSDRASNVKTFSYILWTLGNAHLRNLARRKKNLGPPRLGRRSWSRFNPPPPVPFHGILFLGMGDVLPYR